jgi:hypothetical protein
VRHRWIIDRLALLAGCFAIDVCEYAVMDNHLHLILRTHPELAWAWSDEEVAIRWLSLRGRLLDSKGAFRTKSVARLTEDAPRIDELRRRLASLEWFHRDLKTPCSRLWNRQEKVTGHFWQGRYGSVIAKSDVSLVNQAIYVLLNRIRCGAEHDLGASERTSIGGRIEELRREIAEGRHADALAGFEDRFERADWTPVFPCKPGSVGGLDDLPFAQRVAEGRQRHCIRSAVAKDGREQQFLAVDAPIGELEPFVLPQERRDSDSIVRPDDLPRHRLRPRPSLETSPHPRRCPQAWFMPLKNPFRSSQAVDRGVPVLPGLGLAALISLADEEGRLERADKPGRIAASAPPALETIRRSVAARATDPRPSNDRPTTSDTSATIASARAWLARDREALAAAVKGSCRVVWASIRRSTGLDPPSEGQRPTAVT